MHITRSGKIWVLLVVDAAFCITELAVGYTVGSLALVADSFHMLNDIMSLAVALYAIKLSSKSASDQYSYGYHRAEILAALFNGVFLLALCFSIFLSAIERFAHPNEITDPRLVVIVGCAGLAANIFGLLLFQDHAHHGHSHGHSHGSPAAPPARPMVPEGAGDTGLERISTTNNNDRRTDPVPSLYGHPVQTRAAMVQAANELVRTVSPSASAAPAEATDERGMDLKLVLPVTDMKPSHDVEKGESRQNGGGGHGHSHGHAEGSMNMRGLLLHVLGDALGNIGVIVSGLIIWLTPWSFRNYFDPICSIIITIIILVSALPLVRSTSFILLQGVPRHISLGDVRQDICAIDGVLSVHEFHVWQLSETRVVASIHVWVSKRREYMAIAREIRKTLHAHGIHSGTIQPEFYENEDSVSGNNQLQANVDSPCLIACPPDAVCDVENACCPPAAPLPSIAEERQSSNS